jgi:hypothetical protein
MPRSEVSKVDIQTRSDPRWALVERIAGSSHFKSSVRLSQFLLYVAECAIREAPEEATEQQIGIRVFGRPPGYNSSEDSIVRTHARLLRQKLDSYFAEEGANEKILLEMPKGHYVPTFQPRGVAARGAHVPIAVRVEEPQAANSLPVQRVPAWPHHGKAIISGVTIAVVLAVGILIWHSWRQPQSASAAVETFWHPFLTGEPPIVIFSNALFSGNSISGLKYAAPPSASEAADGSYVDTYTGIGELASVYNLTRLFDSHHARFILKRSLLVTWDEAAVHNLIFIGSRAENPSLRVLPETTDFTMVASPDSAGFVNHNPKAGEPAIYSRPEHPLTSDYAIVALVPGVQPNTHILIFSGLTTFGTQAAVEYVCQPENAADLLKRITGPKGDVRPFEAVLETTIGGGVPLATHLVTIRVH